MTSPEETLVTLVTAPPDVAASLASDLVESRLAACANVVWGVSSFYRWQGAVQRDEEALLVVKTIAGNFEALAELVQRLHPYETPEIIAIPLTAGSPAYLEWIAESVAAESRSDS